MASIQAVLAFTIAMLAMAHCRTLEETDPTSPEVEDLEAEDRANSLCSKYGPGHTMCLSIPGPLCGKEVTTNVGFTDAEKKFMVDYHNEKRRYVKD